MSEELDDLLGGITREASARDDRFEVQVTHQLLRLLGLTAQEVRTLEAGHGSPLDCTWLNAQDYFPFPVGAGRDFRFSFEDFFLRPRQHPIVLASLEFARSRELTSAPWVFVFNVHGQGRMAATNFKLSEVTHIHIAHPAGTVNIAPLADVFSPFKGKLCPT